jgi:hypothetical protein
MTLEQRVKKLEEKVFKNESDKEHCQREIDLDVKNIGALLLNSFYFEKDGTRVSISPIDVPRYMDMLINNIKFNAKKLLMYDVS